MPVLSRPVSSSMISAVSYDTDTNEMTVTFANGRDYVYDQVPEDEFHALVNAPSVGKHFNSAIKDVYDGR